MICMTCKTPEPSTAPATISPSLAVNSFGTTGLGNDRRDQCYGKNEDTIEVAFRQVF